MPGGMPGYGMIPGAGGLMAAAASASGGMPQAMSSGWQYPGYSHNGMYPGMHPGYQMQQGSDLATSAWAGSYPGYPGYPAQQYNYWEEARKRADAERQAKNEEERRRRDEERRVAGINRLVQRARFTASDNLDNLQNDLEHILAEEIYRVNEAQRQKLKEDVERALEQVKKGITLRNVRAAAKEAHKAKTARVEAIVAELTAMTGAGEEACRGLLEAATAWDKLPVVAGIQERREALESLEKAAAEADNLVKVRGDFFTERGAEIQTLPITVAMQQGLMRLRQQVKDFTQMGAHLKIKVQLGRQLAQKHEVAANKIGAQKAIFDKYDKDADGFLNRNETANYARGEYDCVLTEETLDRIWRTLVTEASSGVAFAEFHRLKVTVGIAREVARDKKKAEGFSGCRD